MRVAIRKGYMLTVHQVEDKYLAIIFKVFYGYQVLIFKPKPNNS